MRPLLPAMGITRVADVTGLDCIGLPVAMAYRPNARSLAVSPGKGLHLTAAKASAVMEAVEGWHAERIVAPLLFASYNELRFERELVDVAGLPRRDQAPFDPNRRILWIEGTNLLEPGTVWIPFEVVHTNYTHPLPPNSEVLLASSNGLASGTTREEAIAHAIFEIVERDGAALWRAAAPETRRATFVSTASVTDPACRSVLGLFERAGMSVGCWDITSDVGIPSFRCAIADAGGRSLATTVPGLGAGCHARREVALLRALTEAAQTRLTLIVGSRDDMGAANHARVNDEDRHRRLLATLNGGGDSGLGSRRLEDAPTFEGNSVAAELAWALDRLRAIGLRQVLMVDLTKPRLGIPVVRLVIPHLEGISEAPGYLGGARLSRRLEEGGRR